MKLKKINKNFVKLGIVLLLITICLIIILLCFKKKETTIPVSISDWGLRFQDSGYVPVGNASSEYLKQFDAMYVGNTTRKVIYLTFDAGYENGYTSSILDTLKKHNAPAAFFLVNHYLKTASALVQRMKQEGHIIGNHTYNHPDMSKITTVDGFRDEIKSLEVSYKTLIGEEIPKFYRPPQGKFSETNLIFAKELGYKTIFWSLSYKDWDPSDIQKKEDILSLLSTRVHPGAIVLLHNTTKMNAEILDELLTMWEEMDYSFESLDTIDISN